MAKDGSVPSPCDPEIFQNGEPVALLDASSDAAERWVRAVAAEAAARVDWHYSGGVAQVLHLGDAASCARVEAAITKLQGALQGRIMKRLSPGAEGLYRRGVTPAPIGAVAGFYDGDGGSVFIVEK